MHISLYMPMSAGRHNRREGGGGGGIRGRGKRRGARLSVAAACVVAKAGEGGRWGKTK